MKKPQVRQRFGVVASIMVPDLALLRKALTKAHGAHTIEIRLDEIRPNLDRDIVPIIKSIRKTVILSLNPRPLAKWDDTTLHERWLSWRTFPKELRQLICDKSSKVFVDWGHELIMWCARERRDPIFTWSKIGVSFHDFTKTPGKEELTSQLSAMRRTKAEAFIKIVTMAKGENDLRIIERVAKTSKDPRGRPLIAFAMGPIGTQSRRECLSWGAATYGYVPGFGPTAPGQLSVMELLEDPFLRMTLRR